MARQKRLVPENPYLPIAGLNQDDNGLALSPNECTDILNLRVFPNEVSTRGGSKGFALNVPGSDAILKFWTYKAPNGTEVLFAFTKNCIYKYNDATKLWSYAMKFVVLDSCESATGWYLGNLAANTNGYHYEGTYSLMDVRAWTYPGSITDGSLLYNKKGVGIMNWDLSTYTHIVFHFSHIAADNVGDLNLKVNFYSDNNLTTLIGSVNVISVKESGLNATGLIYKRIIVPLSNPALFASVKSFSITVNGNHVITGGVEGYFIFTIDYICAISPLASDVEYWHASDFLDDTLGSIVVATGSLPPKPNESEDDGANRVLYYYDPAVGYFQPLILTNRITTINEDGGANGPATASVVTGNCDNITGTDTLVAGTFSLYTAELGTIASSSAILASGGSATRYALIPTNPGDVIEGTSSYVDTTGNWSCSFANITYSGLKLYVSYTRLTTSTYKPRFVWNFHNRLLFVNTYEGTTYLPWRARWTEVGKYNLILNSSYQDIVDNDLSPVMGGDYSGYYLNLYKGDSICQVSYSDTLIYNFITVWKDGTYASRTIQTFQQRQYFLGKDDVYCWNGSSLQSITRRGVELTTMTEKTAGSYRIRNSLFRLLNVDKLWNCFGTLYPKYQEYWLWVVKTGETYPTAVYVYNIQKDIWYYFEFPACTCSGNYYTNPGNTIASLNGNINEQGWSFNDGVLEGVTRAIILAYSTGNTYLIDETQGSDAGYYNAYGTWIPGTAISSRLITRDFTFSSIPLHDRCSRVDFEAYGNSIACSIAGKYSTDSTTFLQSSTIAVSPEFTEVHYFPDLVGEHFRVCFIATSYMAIRWVQPFSIQEELVDD